MTTEDRPRLYIVARSDISSDGLELENLAAQCCVLTLSQGENKTPDLIENYNNQGQPKIAVKAKNEAALLRAYQEALQAGINCDLGKQDGKPMVLTVGPVFRDELPSFIRKMQLYTGEQLDRTNNPNLHGEKTWVFIRNDLQMPQGKLLAQVSHGAWSIVQNKSSVSTNVECILAENYKQIVDICNGAKDAGLASDIIVDHGHTVFTEPTPTVVSVGPCLFEQLPNIAKECILSHTNPSIKL